jgi:hypothetical protein
MVKKLTVLPGKSVSVVFDPKVIFSYSFAVENQPVCPVEISVSYLFHTFKAVAPNPL